MKTKSVFFLGAGFSKAIYNFYLDLKNLSEEIETNYYMNDNDSLTLHFNAIPSDYKGNLEVLLTYLSSNLPYKTYVQVING